VASIVNEHLPNENPMALAFMSALTLTEDQVNEIEEEINNTGAPEIGVSNWLENNRDVVQPWIDGAQNVLGS
jgi:glycine betaine/proline transport system substrate-binding protein